MKARFGQEGMSRIVVMLEPESREEAYLLAAFMRFDSNALSGYVERLTDGRIERLTLHAAEAS